MPVFCALKLLTFVGMSTVSGQWPSQFPYPTWYLDAVSGKAGWDFVQVEGSDGTLAAVLPFQKRRSLGLRLITSPPLCPRLGPLLTFPSGIGSFREKLSYERKLLIQLNDALPAADYYRISWPYQLDFGLPWQQLGWVQRVRYSYVIRLRPPENGLWGNIRPTRRHEIRKAYESLTVQSSEDWKLLYQLIDEVFLYRNAKRQIHQDMVETLFRAAQSEQACQMWVATDKDGNPHAAILLLYDSTTAYNLLLGSDPAMRQSGAVSLLLWHAIRWAKEQGLTHFDFEGSHLPGVEPFFRSFGAEAWPYYEFIKGKRWLLALRQLRGRL